MEWGRGVSAEMKLVIIPRFIGAISIPHRVEGVHFPTKIIPTSSNRLKHILSSDITTSMGFKNLDFKLEKINKNSDRNCKKDIFPDGSFHTYGVKHHSQNNQYECMAPNKFKDFQSAIKGFLEFMNGRYLHRILVFFFHVLSIPTKFLKSNVFLKKYENLLRYCDNYLSINKLVGTYDHI